MRFHLLLLGILFNSVVPTSGSKWTAGNIAPSQHGVETDADRGRVVNVTLSSGQLCRLDRLQIQWEAGRMCDLSELGIAYVRTGSTVGNVISLEDTKITNDPPTVAQESGLITCVINERHCIPKVKNISAQPDKNRLVLVFESDTNQQEVLSGSAVYDALDITPKLDYSDMKGEWVTADTLELELGSENLQRILSAHAAGETIEVTARSELPKAKRGTVSIRPAEAGAYEVIVVDRARGNEQLPPHLAASHSIVVALCDDEGEGDEVLTAPVAKGVHTGASVALSSSSALSISSTSAKKILSITGPAAITGQDSLTFADSVVDPQKSGTFSVSAWIRLVEPPTGQFRAFLHKGSADGKTRTPSVWLMPNDNRLSVRISTEKNSDIGADSVGALPTNEWAFLSLVFSNNTQASSASASGSAGSDAVKARDAAAGLVLSHPADYYEQQGVVSTNNGPNTASVEGKSGGYSVSVYINGALDVKRDFSDPALGNEHSAMFFKDVSFAGPRALVSEFALWDAALTAAEVTSMYLSSAGRTQRVAVDAALDILASAGNKLVFATSPARAEEGVIEEDPLVAMLLQRAQESLVACEPFEARLDLYASAAERDSAEALYKWALLVKQGSEMANSACGVATAEDTDRTPSALKSAASSLWSAGTAAAPSSAESLADQERAVQAMLIAADMGHAPALVSLAFALVNGAGIDAFFRTDVPVSTTQIPVHPTYHTVSTTGAHVYRTSRLQNAIASYLRNRPAACANIPWKFPATSGLTLDRHALAQSVLHWNSSALPRAGAADPEGTGSHCPDASQLSMGLLQLAAMHRNTEAHQALSYRYREGLGVEADPETAVFYQRLPGRVTADEFHVVGAQAVVETDRINDSTAPEISRGNEGNDDELIQHQKIRAKEGHLPSILAMADLYYYGARGLPRDHGRALRYYDQAAALGDESGLCGAASMYLKGEGAPTNITRAISLYENASAMGSIRALNGLGYMYFYGQSVPQNQTKAFEYFMAAAAYESDGDSLFNAAHCLENGIGVEKDVARAVQLYTVAANKLGSFNCIHTLAVMYQEGRGVARSAATALKYFTAATSIGSWAGWLRRGFDQYLRGHYGRSLGAYLHGAEFGIEVSQSNAAYVLRTKMKVQPRAATTSRASPVSAVQAPDGALQTCSSSSGGSACETLSSKMLVAELEDPAQLKERMLSRLYRLSAHHGNRESYLHLGTCYFKGACGVGAVDQAKALWYYSKASFLGHPLSSAYVGVMHHFGLGVPVNHLRAERYYALAIEQGADPSVATIVQSLKYALGMKDYYFMMPVNMGVDYVVRTLWHA